MSPMMGRAGIDREGRGRVSNQESPVGELGESEGALPNWWEWNWGESTR